MNRLVDLVLYFSLYLSLITQNLDPDRGKIIQR